MKSKMSKKPVLITESGDSELAKIDLTETGMLKNNDELNTQMENDTNMLLISGNKKSKNLKNENEAENDQRPQKRYISKKEKKRLEKVLERKNKTLRRDDLLEKLASVQVNATELKMYSSVRDIGQKEKRKMLDSLEAKDDDSLRTVNAISGSNKRKKLNKQAEEQESGNESVDTDDMSSDSEIDEENINKALEQFKSNQLEIEKAKIAKIDLNEYKTNRIDSDEEQDKPVANPDNKNKRETKYVHVERRNDIKESRSKLPIITEEQLIMEKIYDNDIVIICGETGSGKTTQMPQFLYEAGYAENDRIIGVTEPRRVAAISMSKRVNDEMNFKETDSVVSYQIRYEGTTSPNTRIKFMTDGVLLKEVQTDFLLTKYNAIIIDEAHERSVYTDILIGLLSRIVPLRNKKENPLKLIVMSATLRVEDFTENRRLFKQIPPSIKVDSRQFPVSTHFNKHTYQDYLAEAFRKVCKIHRRLPEGGILVFLTGQQEVNVLCNKLRKTFPHKPSHRPESTEAENPEEEAEEPKELKKTRSRANRKVAEKPSLSQAPKINLDSYSSIPLDDELEIFESNRDEDDLDEQFKLEEDGLLSEGEEDEDENENGEENPLRKSGPYNSSSEKPLYVLPLYSLLSSDKQIKVFEKVPDNYRLCVVATNIAETSLTIPNIKYVVDTGKIKMKFYDKITGVSTFKVCWTSKASADQRTGRAGRTSPGHCYRLYSSALFNDEFPKFTEPEIARKPVEDLILQMKDLGIDRISNFPFPTPPDQGAVKAAENLLVQLGALEFDKSRTLNMRDEQITKITNLGKTMACFPINPRYSKMLTLASQQDQSKDILSYVVCMISGLSVPELFIDGDTLINANPTSKKTDLSDSPEQVKVKYSQIRQSWLSGVPGSHTALLGDLMLLLVALGAVEYEQYKSTKSNEQTCIKFCEQYGIRYKAILEARKLRKQLVNTVNVIFPDLNLSIDPLMSPPSQENAKLLRQIVLSGMVDRIAKRYDHVLVKDDKEIKNAYQGLLLQDPIFIHPSSVLFKELPNYVCYVEMIETAKMYMKGVCAIDSSWLPVYLPSQCSFEKPVVNETEQNYEELKPRFESTRGVVVCHRESTFGNYMWKVKPVEVDFPQSLDLYKWFARFFLDGEVVDSLKKYSNVLIGSPSTMLKSWAKLQPRTESLLNALITQNCSSRQKLMEIWSTRNDYLLNEYLMWVPESLHFELKLKWPPINQK